MRFYSNRLSSAIKVLPAGLSDHYHLRILEFVSPSIAADAAVVSILKNCFHSSIHPLTECLPYKGIVALKRHEVVALLYF